jgi:hypothetical protein
LNKINYILTLALTCGIVVVVVLLFFVCLSARIFFISFIFSFIFSILVVVVGVRTRFFYQQCFLDNSHILRLEYTLERVEKSLEIRTLK